MEFWWLAMKDALVFGRDRKALLTLIFMPMLLIGILGAAFGEMMGENEMKISKFKAGVVNLDQGPAGKVLEQEIFLDGLPELVAAKSMNEADMLRSLKNQEIAVGVVLPEDFTEAIMSGTKAEVNVTSIPSAAIPSAVVENIVFQFAQSMAIDAMGTRVSMENPETNDLKTQTAEPVDFETFKESAIKQDQRPVSSFQYYAAGMGVMFLLMTVVTGVSTIIEEKEQRVYHRLLVSKLTDHHYLEGKIIGLFSISLIQFLVIIFGTMFLYDVQWGESMSGIILVGIAFVFSVCGLGLLLSAFIKTEKVFSVSGMLATQIMAAVGGSMVPLYVFPDWLNASVKVLPNALALQTFLDLMSGAGFQEILGNAGILFGVGVVSLVLAWVILTAKRGMHHA